MIDTITSKVVLILGRFTPERKAVLDAIREKVRQLKYVLVLFDFKPLSSQTTVETVSTLARMARFVIADLTDAKSILQELQAIVPVSPSVVVQPLLLASQEEPGMFDFFRRFPWVLDTQTRCFKENVLYLSGRRSSSVGVLGRLRHAVFTLALTICFSEIAQPQEDNAFSLSPATHTSFYPEVMCAHCIVPTWDQHYLLHLEIDKALR